MCHSEEVQHLKKQDGYGQKGRSGVLEFWYNRWKKDPLRQKVCPKKGLNTRQSHTKVLQPSLLYFKKSPGECSFVWLQGLGIIKKITIAMPVPLKGFRYR